LPQNDFSKILLSAVEESLSSLGDSSKQAIFFHLETSFKIKGTHSNSARALHLPDLLVADAVNVELALGLCKEFHCFGNVFVCEGADFKSGLVAWKPI
jgi:hypothetical protein